MTKEIINKLKEISELDIRWSNDCNDKEIYEFLVIIQDYLERHNINIIDEETNIIYNLKEYISAIATSFYKNWDMLGYILCYQLRDMDKNVVNPGPICLKMSHMTPEELYKYKHHLYHNSFTKLNYYLQNN